MAFGISCGLSPSRKHQVEQRWEDESLCSDIPMVQKPVRGTRFGNEKRPRTLQGCVLGEGSMFYGEPKWPRCSAYKSYLRQGSNSLTQQLPSVRCNRPTRHAFTHTTMSPFARSQELAKSVKETLRSLNFPVLDMLRPTKPKGMPAKQDNIIPCTTHCATVKRYVTLPKTIRSGMVCFSYINFF